MDAPVCEHGKQKHYECASLSLGMWQDSNLSDSSSRYKPCTAECPRKNAFHAATQAAIAWPFAGQT